MKTVNSLLPWQAIDQTAKLSLRGKAMIIAFAGSYVVWIIFAFMAWTLNS